MRAPEWAAGIEARAMRVRHRFDPLQEWVESSILWRAWERVLENEFIDRSVALAAKAFVSLFPALIVVAAFAPQHVRNSILQTITHRAGLSGSGLETVKGAFKSSDDVRKATGFVGLIFTFFYVNSFTSALSRVYTRAWRRPPGGRASAYALGAAWLIGVVAYFAIIGAMRSILRGGPETAAFALGALLASIGLWWLTPWLMLQRQVRWRPLLTGAILTGVGMSVYAASATLWMPRTVSENQDQFGFFGVALALVTWLSGAGMIIVVSACVAPVVAEDDGWIGRLARGSETAPLLVEGAKPSLPPPVRAPTLVDAIRARSDAPEDEL
jgi:membrane protein